MNKIYQKPFFGEKNAGFTLIELLVVVLIIGILSAVALPQYQKAVARARTAEALATLRTAAQAVEVYILEEGSFPKSWENVAVVPPGTLGAYKRFGDQIQGKYHKYTLTAGRIDVGSRNNNQYPGFLYISTAASYRTGFEGKHFYCYYIDYKNGKQKQTEALCKSMSGNKESTGWSSSGHDSVWYPLD